MLNEANNTNKSSLPAHLADLIARAKSGDESAFEQLYNEYFTQLYRYVLIRVGSQDDADDIVQLIFLKFYKNLENWHDQGYQPSAYLYSIARSVIADHFRKVGRSGKKIQKSEEFLDILSDTSQNLHSGVIVQEEITELYTAIKTLPRNYQEALLLRYSDNLSSQEIAKIIGKSDVATRKLLSRSVQALSEVVAKQQKKDNI
jgi:RNA polymerase sigma-70 factor (ECF subfamily)